METNKKTRVDANRMVNISYLIAGAYAQSLEDMSLLLNWADLDLRYNDKFLINQLSKLTKQLLHLIDKLQMESVLTMGGEDQAIHEDTYHRFYAIFMAIIDRAGFDSLADLRLLSIYNNITRYKSLVNIPLMETKDRNAWWSLRDKIAKDPDLKEDGQGNIFISEVDKKTGKTINHQVLQIGKK